MSPLLFSLLASLWQAGILWGALQILNRAIRGSSPTVRYRITLACLFLVAGGWVATWAYQEWKSDAPVNPSVLTFSPSVHREIESAQAETVYSRPEDPASISWQQVAVALWEIGVVLGCIRLAWSMRLAGRIRAASVRVTEARWIVPLKELGETMGHKFEIALHASTRVACPVVMGFLKPAIILPASALTGVPSDVIKATLAHEIAHLVRWDYIFNLVQMGIEALLFFNPFVWLISQSVRREREVCCDQMAGEACGGPQTYSGALLWWGREITTLPSAVMAINRNRGGLRERVRRLLYPHEAPLARPEWPVAAGVAAMVPLFLILSIFVVHAAVSELTPKQRVALIEFLAQPFREEASRKASPGTSQKFSGTVIDEKGNPVAKARWFVFPDAAVGLLTGIVFGDGKYSGEAPRGAITLIVRAVGFAPTVINYRAEMSRENARIVLTKGHDFRIRCVDEKGAPVHGAWVKVESDEFPFWMSRAATDENGWALLTRLPDTGRGTLTFDAPGYQTAQRNDVELSHTDLGRPVRLAGIKPALIRVEDEMTGAPIQGVRLRICAVRPGSASFVDPRWNGSGKATDAEGVARLDSLNPDLSYDMIAEGKKRGMTFLFNPREGMSRTIRLPRERILKVKFLHLPEGEFTLQYSQRETETSSNAEFARLDARMGEAQVDLTGLMPVPVDLFFLKQSVRSPELTKEVTEMVIDYEKIKPPASVHVVLKTKVREGQAHPMGVLSVNWAPAKDAGVWDGLRASLHDGLAEFDLPEGSYFHLNNDGLLGGRIDENIYYHVQKNDGPIEVPVVSAGIIRVKVLEPDGRLAESVFVTGRNMSETKAPEIEIKNGASTRDAREWYVSGPVELGADQYGVVANLGIRYSISPPFKVDAANPIQDVVLTLPAFHTRSIRVVDDQGNALRGVTLLPTLDVAPVGMLTGRSITTDANGVAHIEVGENSPGKLLVRPISGVLVPATYRVDLPPSGEAKVVLEKGKKLTGRFIDRSTGSGLKGCSIGWMDPSSDMLSERQPVGTDGRFEFDNVPDRKVFLSTGILKEKEVLGESYARPGGQELIFEVRDKAPAR